MNLPKGSSAEKYVKVTITEGTKVRTGFTNDGALQIEVIDDLGKWFGVKQVKLKT